MALPIRTFEKFSISGNATLEDVVLYMRNFFNPMVDDLNIIADLASSETQLDEKNSPPATLPIGTQCRIYMKDDKLIIQYNDDGTVRYKFLDLTGTGVAWQHTTIAP